MYLLGQSYRRLVSAEYAAVQVHKYQKYGHLGKRPIRCSVCSCVGNYLHHLWCATERTGTA